MDDEEELRLLRLEKQRIETRIAELLAKKERRLPKSIITTDEIELVVRQEGVDEAQFAEVWKQAETSLKSVDLLIQKSNDTTVLTTLERIALVQMQLKLSILQKQLSTDTPVASIDTNDSQWLRKVNVLEEQAQIDRQEHREKFLAQSHQLEVAHARITELENFGNLEALQTEVLQVVSVVQAKKKQVEDLQSQLREYKIREENLQAELQQFRQEQATVRQKEQAAILERRKIVETDDETDDEVSEGFDEKTIDESFLEETLYDEETIY